MKNSLVLIALVATHASAGILTFTDLATFQSALTGGAYTETFSGIGSGIISSPQAFTNGTFSYEIASPSLYGNTLGGNQTISLDNPMDPIIVNTFGGSPNAVGGFFFFDNNLGGIASPIAGTVTASNGVDLDVVLNILAPSSFTNFLGFISTSGAFTSITVDRTSLQDSGAGWANIDNLIVGQALSDAPAVPEPASFALLACGLAGIFLARKRSKNS